MISNEGRYLCQWAPATGFLLVTFGTVGALTSFEFSESGQPPLNTRWAENPKLETQELPPWYRLILFESFLGILLLDPAFSSNILLNKFVQVFDTLKIPVHCFGTWDTKVFRKHFFFCYAIFTWIWTFTTYDLTDYQLTVGSFLPAITQRPSCEVIDKSQGDLNSSSSNFFTLCPAWSISIVLLFFEVSISILCVLTWQSRSFHTVRFLIFKAPIVWSILEIAVLRSGALLRWFQLSNNFSTPSLWFLVCKSGHSDRSGPFDFETLVGMRLNP